MGREQPLAGLVARSGAEQQFTSLLAAWRSDPEVVGVILTGSRARPGTESSRSDYDVVLVIADARQGTARSSERRDAALDVSVLTSTAFAAHAVAGSDTEWNRYAFCHCRVLKDTVDRDIERLAEVKGTLSEEELAEVGPAALDGFLNAVYRCVKNDRDGEGLAARLDAAQAIPSYLTYVFALHRRITPYNKYLAWELEHYPLSESVWSRDRLLPSIESVLSSSPAPAVRRLFTELEPLAHDAGHGAVLDGWGDDLDLMRT